MRTTIIENMKRAFMSLSLLLLLFVSIGCRGQRSELPPIHPNWNMDDQTKFNAQEDNNIKIGKKYLFKDKRAMRTPVSGTVAQSHKGQDLLKEDDHLHKGMKDGDFAKVLPESILLNQKLLLLGQEKFNVFCSSCHGYMGKGDGTVSRFSKSYGGLIKDLHQGAKSMSLGQLFVTISSGRPASGGWNMPPFKSQLSAKERWAVVAYIRALQLTRHKVEDYKARRVK